jgi:hypothetical protein
MHNINNAKSKFKRALELTFQDYLGALPEGNKIINVGRGIGYGYEHNYDPSIRSILDSYHRDPNFDSALTNCVGHDDRTPSLLMSWIPSWKFKSDYMCAFHCFAGCPRTKLVSFFNKRLAHKLEAIDQYWKEKKKEKKKRERKQKQAHLNVDAWLTSRGL